MTALVVRQDVEESSETRHLVPNAEDFFDPLLTYPMIVLTLELQGNFLKLSN